MAAKITLLKAFVTGEGVGASNFFNYAGNLDFNFSSIESMVHGLIDEVTAVQGPNALLPRDLVTVNDPLHPGGAVSSGIVGQHSFLVAIGAPSSNLNVARGQAVIGGLRVENASDVVLAGSGASGTRWVALSSGGTVTLETAAASVPGGLDIASINWNGAAFTGSPTYLPRVFFDGDDYDLQRTRLAAVGPGATPTFPIRSFRSVAARLATLERAVAGLVTGGEGETIGPRGFGGSAAAPGLISTDGTTFDVGSGFFRAAANDFGVAVSGSALLRFAAAQVLAAAAGAVGTPVLSRLGDIDTGFYFPGANRLAAAAGGLLAEEWRLLSAGVMYRSAPNVLRVRTSATALALVSGSALVALSMDAEAEDIGAWITPPSTSHTVPSTADGLYLIQAGVRFDEASAGGANQNTGNTRRVAVTVNGTEVPGSGTWVASRGSSALTEDTRLPVSVLVPLVAGDIVRLAAAQDSGASMTVDAALRLFQVA